MMGSHHLVTVCMFCLLCATHSTCSAHTELSHKGLRRMQDLRHEKFKASENVNINRSYMRNLARIRKSAEVPQVENVIDEGNKLDSIENRLSPDVIPISNHILIDNKLTTDSIRKFNGKCSDSACAVSADELSKTTFSEDKRLVKHRQTKVKRDAHLLDAENPKPLESNSNSRDSEVSYNPILKEIDVNFYIHKLFSQFGDTNTMTMNLEGFERMLRELDLKKMLLEERIVTPGGFQSPPVESVVNGVRSNSTNVTCVSSVDLILSLNEQQEKIDHRKEHSTEHSHSNRQQNNLNLTLSKLKTNVVLKPEVFSKICPILLYQKFAQTSYERQGCLDDRNFAEILSEKKNTGFLNDSEHNDDEDEVNSYDNNRTTVWVYSTLCILVISACGLLGVAVIPIMDLTYYQQILQFLVALAIGTLSGDAMLHLLPHALSPDEHGHGRKHSHSSHEPHSHDSMWKGLVAVLGVVFFYFTEKGLTLVTEWRKRKMRLNKENKLPSRVRVMRNDNLGCLKGSGSCSSRTGSTGFLRIPTAIFKINSKNNKQNVDPNNINSGKICKHKYSEYPYCYDEIATDTHDDHHVRDGHLHSHKNNAGNNKLSHAKDHEDNNVCVVSFNNVKDNNFNANNHEPTANDSLIVHNYDDSVADSQLQNQANRCIAVNNKIVKLSENAASDDEKKAASKTADCQKKHSHATINSDEIDEKKSVNDRESYTVILREHSQTHHGHSHSHGHVHSPPSSLSSVVWMVIMGDGLHNFTDGMAIGAAFSSNIAGGFSTAIAVLCHELPHEIGDFAVLLKAGMSAKRAVFYNMLSSILCLFGMILGVIVGHTPEATAWVFAAAAGMFMYIALVDMIPELTSSHSNEGSFCQCILQFCGLVSGIGIMLLIAMYEHELKKLFG